MRPKFPSPRASPRALARIAAACLAVGVGACVGGGGELGASCVEQDDCAADLQCLAGVCLPRCDSHVECGDGSRCDDGVCVEVSSAIGDPCAREIDCGAGQTCALAAADDDDDGRLDARCQAIGEGEATGAACDDDLDCRAGACALGRCTELCVAPVDCSPSTTCAELPRRVAAAAPRFGACLPATGVIRHRHSIDGVDPVLEVPVPSTARSFALVARVDEPGVVVGVRELRGPDGQLLHQSSGTPEQDDFFANPIRHLPALGASTLLVPNTPRIALEVGLYRVALAARFGQGLPAPAVPTVEVLYKLDDSAVLDLHFVFLELADHPCQEAWGGGTLDAASAPASPDWQAHVARMTGVLAGAGIAVGDVTYRDLVDRADLDGLEVDRLADLLATSTATTGLTIFVVRSIAPVGVQALAGRPAPPRTPGTGSSGAVIGADVLCYRSWSAFSRTTLHAAATAMGLYRNREPGPPGHVDPIDDSDTSSANLMYFGELGGHALSAGQAEVLRRYPGLR